MSLLLIVGVMVFAAGLNYRYLVGAALVALPVLYIVLDAAPTTGGAGCSRSGIPGRIRSATASRSSSR